MKNEKEEEKGRNGGEEAEKTATGGGQGTEDEKIDELLMEANKMLRMIREKETSEAKINQLHHHQQLDEIKRSIKTLKLTRLRERPNASQPMKTPMASWAQALHIPFGL